MMQRKGIETSGGSSAVTTVAVAVKGIDGAGTRRAVRWAAENLLPRANRFVFVHVMPTITDIPSPTGKRIPVDQFDENVVAMYKRDLKEELQQIFVPFKRLCKHSNAETLLLEHDDPAEAILKFVSESGFSYLVMGSYTSNFLTRKVQDLPMTVLRHAPETCEVFVVCKERIITKSSDQLLPAADGASSSQLSSTQDIVSKGSVPLRSYKSFPSLISGGKDNSLEPSIVSKDADIGSRTSSDQCIASTMTGASRKPIRMSMSTIPRHSYGLSQEIMDMYSSTDHNYGMSRALVDMNSSPVSTLVEGRSHLNTNSSKQFKPESPTKTQKADVKVEVERLRKEVHETIAMYKQACDELVHKQTKVQILSSECLEEARRVTAAIEKEEMSRIAAAEEKERNLKAMKEVEEAKAMLAREFCDRQLAELTALKQRIEKKKIIDQLFVKDRRYRKYTKEEIEAATDNFSPSKVIGEGGYGKVYNCSLDHTPVAVKVLQPDSFEKKEEFLKEVSVLSQLRHPHVVLLLGACPETGCLVYEYLEKGSLNEYIFHKNGKPPLPWYIRFRIIYEIACGLAFLHNSKPEPIIHRDLKPGNILLDRNFVSKIGDVGLAKLVSDAVPDSITVYQDSVIAGTLYYMDPEYQRTGTIRPKSDLFAFGVIILQLLTARHPNGLLFCSEDAIKRGCFLEMLDESVKDWPISETEELARIALNCSQLRCRDRPDLDSEILPALKQILESANKKVKIERNNLLPPNHYFCPILKEIMEDPHIAADGFTYEHRAIESWIKRHDISPVTKRRLRHPDLTPNHTLRSAIQEWRSRMEFSIAITSQND